MSSTTNPSPAPRRAPIDRQPGGRKRVLLALSYYDHRHHAGVARYAAEHGWALEDAYTQTKSMPRGWEGDGVVSFHSDDADMLEWLQEARRRGVWVVDMGESSTPGDFPRVCADHEQMASLAVSHFAARGYRTIGFTWLIDRPMVRRRLEALRVAGGGAGLKVVELPLERIVDLGRADGAAPCELPLGLVAANDAVAVRALRTCEDAGVLVPEQVAILGIDNFEYRCVPAAVPLSSVDVAQERIGYEAAALLDRLMSGAPAPAGPVRVPPVGIVERDSTDMRAVADVEVARALRFISRHFKTRIGLGDVARATSVSLRRLQSRFKEALGQTILQEINTRRVRHAQRLLRTTNDKVNSVAADAGFGSAVKLIRVFNQYVGTSPKRYRKQGRPEVRVKGADKEGGSDEAGGTPRPTANFTDRQTSPRP